MHAMHGQKNYNVGLFHLDNEQFTGKLLSAVTTVGMTTTCLD